MKASKEQSDASSYIPGEKDLLRCSKSSFFTYAMCPRQYYWKYVASIPRPPPNEAMIRGTDIHSMLEYGLLDGPDALTVAAAEKGMEDDEGVAGLVQLLHMIANDMGGLDVVEVEVKHECYENYEDNEIVWVAIIDAVLRHPDGGLILTELKTGGMNVSKLARTRKELVFYSRVLDLLDYEKVTHFLYIAPDYEVPDQYANDKLMAEANKKGKTVWIGRGHGIAIMEPVNTRSFNAFAKSLSDTIATLTIRQWPMKWNNYFCPVWCDYHLACESELTGESEGIMNG